MPLLEVKNVSYACPETSSNALCDASLQVKKNTSVAFVDLLEQENNTYNVILGLLTPNSGEIKFRGLNKRFNVKSWKKIVGYVPQTFCDDTITNNIAFSMPSDKINMIKLKSRRNGKS